VQRATAALVAACVGPAVEAGAVTAPAVRAASLHSVKRHIDARIADPGLSTDEICRAFGLSRARLYRLFQPLGGVSEYIQARRLDRCFAELTEPARGPRRIKEIAQNFGYTSQAAFNRAFRRQFQMSPGDAREAAIARLPGQPVSSFGHSNPSSGSLDEWLRSLATH
jgi:AraC-like DNA-binding protein